MDITKSGSASDRYGVVIKPAQRIIDARRAEQSQRLGGAGRQLQRAIGDRVIHRGEIWRVENVTQRRRNGERCLNVDVPTIGEINRDRLVQLAYLDRHAMVFDERSDLLGEIGSEQVRPRVTLVSCTPVTATKP